jgi:hypothetical protein
VLRKYTVPLAGPYTSRISAVNASNSASGYVGVGVVGLMVVGKSTQATDKDGRYVNCVAQTILDQTTGKKRLCVVKRPGFTTQNTPASGEKGQALLVWTGQGAGDKVISAFGATNSTVYDGTSSLGAITGRCTGITETSINGTATLTITSTDNTGWYVSDGGTATEITDGDWPGDTETLAGTFAHMDGFPFIMTTRGRLWAGDINSITAWTANNFTATNAYPDKGIGCVRWKNFIMAFGVESLEFYYNAGLSPFPLARAHAMTQKVGAVSADAISRIADTIFWCGTTPEGGMSIFQWDGTISRLSAPEVEAIMILAGASNISLSTIRFYGRSFLLVRAGPTTLAYCIEEKMWHEWSSTTPLWYKCASVMLGGTMVNYAVSNVATSGKVYLMNHASLSFTDDGTTFTARVQSPPEDGGTNATKFYHDLDIVADVEGSTSNLTVAYSDDDYASYETWGTVDLAGTRPLRLTGGGSARRRGWALTHSADTPMRIHRAEGRLTVGTN